MKLIPIPRSDRARPTAYRISLGTKELKKAGLLDDKGDPVEVEKTVAEDSITIRKQA